MDWKKLIHDLVASGLTQVEIANRVGCSQPTIAMLASGGQRDVRWTCGEKLRALHRKVVVRRKRPVAELEASHA
jgi:predicted transcriptional regulator